MSDARRYSDSSRSELLAQRLNALYETYDLRDLDPDPLVIVREYSDPRDQEIAGLYAAVLAFGGVRQIMRSVRALFDRMGSEPYAFVSTFEPSQQDMFAGWYHRFIRGDDIAALTWSLRRVLDAHGSLEALFAAGFRYEQRDIEIALRTFVETLKSFDVSPITPGAFYGHLLSSPADGSACKRMNLFLRWMIRTTEPDLGIWTKIPTSHLVIPLDTHVARISRNLGLTDRATPNWRMAREVTDRLAEFDPTDPVKYDYAICRLGILDHCPRHKDAAVCAECMMRDVCVA